MQSTHRAQSRTLFVCNQTKHLQSASPVLNGLSRWLNTAPYWQWSHCLGLEWTPGQSQETRTSTGTRIQFGSTLRTMSLSNIRAGSISPSIKSDKIQFELETTGSEAGRWCKHTVKSILGKVHFWRNTQNLLTKWWVFETDLFCNLELTCWPQAHTHDSVFSRAGLGGLHQKPHTQ